MLVHDTVHNSFSNATDVEIVSVVRNVEAINEISRSKVPVILKGFVRDWPIVKAAYESDQTLFDYLVKFDVGKTVPVSVGQKHIDNRIFYNDDFSGLNVDKGNAYFRTLLERISAQIDSNQAQLIYMASMGLEECVPGLSVENEIDFDANLSPLASIWIGTRTRIAAHNDLPLNLACVAAGKRRFTLFPPNQTENLYPGPFELTPAGRPISFVDFKQPDFEKFPKFKDAQKVAHIAELEAGDALFIPSMWWHHVEALSDVNVLINYWWRTVPQYLGTPQDVLSHAMLTLRDLPQEEKQIWRDIFEHYVFANDLQNFEHIPEKIRGILNPIDKTMATRLRGFLSSRLKG